MANVKLIIEAIYKGKGIQSAKKELQGLGNEVKDAGGGFRSLLTTVGTVTAGVVAFGIAAKKALDFGAEGAQITRLEDSFQSLAMIAGESGDEILDALDRAARGTVADTDLILSANRAMMLGLGADADQLANLLEVAAFRGRAMGLSTTQAFNDIVTGVGRASPMILDNLGIVIDAEKTYEEYAASIGKTKDELTKAEKTQALLSRTIEEGNKQIAAAGGLVDDTAASYERLDASAKNYFDTVKQGAGESLAPFAEKITEGFEALNKFNEAQREFERQGVSPYIAHRMAMNGIAVATEEASDSRREAIDSLRAHSDALASMDTPAVEENTEALKAQSKAYQALLSSAATINRESEKFVDDEQERANRLHEIENEKVRLRLEQNAVQAAGNLTLEERNKFMTRQIELDNEILALQKESQDAEQDLQKATNQRIFDMALEQAAADGLSSAEFERFQNLQVQLGLVTRASADRAIAERQAADEFAAALSDQTSEVTSLQDALNNIPSGSPYRAAVVIDVIGGIPTLGGGATGPAPYQLAPGYMGGFQEGGSFVVPGSGTGDRPFMMGLEPGEVVTVSPNGGGNVTINIDANVRNMNDLEYLAQEITRRVQRV